MIQKRDSSLPARDFCQGTPPDQAIQEGLAKTSWDCHNTSGQLPWHVFLSSLVLKSQCCHVANFEDIRRSDHPGVYEQSKKDCLSYARECWSKLAQPKKFNHTLLPKGPKGKHVSLTSHKMCKMHERPRVICLCNAKYWMSFCTLLNFIEFLSSNCVSSCVLSASEFWQHHTNPMGGDQPCKTWVRKPAMQVRWALMAVASYSPDDQIIEKMHENWTPSWMRSVDWSTIEFTSKFLQNVEFRVSGCFCQA